VCLSLKETVRRRLSSVHDRTFECCMSVLGHSPETQERPGPPGPSCESLKSSGSMWHPMNFKDEELEPG